MPESVAEHDDVGATNLIIRGLEGSPQNWRHAQHLEVTRADALAIKSFRLVSPCQRWLPRLEDGNRLERACAFHDPAIHAKRSVGAQPIAPGLPDHGDAMGFRIWQRFEQNRFQRAEDRGRRPDAERQREHSDRRECRGGAKAARTIPKIGQECVDDVFPAVLSHLLDRAGYTPEFLSRGAARVIRRESASNLSGGGLIEVVLHFVDDVPIGRRRAGECAKATRELTPERHGTSPQFSITARWRTRDAPNPRFRSRAASDRCA